MMEKSSIAGRTALVTGGAKGIGAACCVRLAQAGANVALHYHTSQQQALLTAKAVRKLGSRVELFSADVADWIQVQHMVAQVHDQMGPVDILVNNAGIFHLVSHTETTPELWQRTLDVNLTGTFNVTWAVKQSMIERRFGRIVNIASIAGLRARSMAIAYASSKAAVIAFTKSLSEALAANNIRVNAVAPGLIETEILAGVEQSQLDNLVAATPMQRIGQPEEIAEVVHFLLSDQSSFLTGQTVVASGGRVLLP